MELSLSVSDKITIDDGCSELIANVLAQGLADEGVSVSEVSVLITTDEEIQLLNHKHRGIDKPTDVLSFPQYHGIGQIPPNADCLGDIVISLPRAAAQADEFGHSLRREMAFLTAHGLLHLLGYDHEQGVQDEQIMMSKQEALLTKLSIAR
ncbi:MAG: rRNA maturation RNase YbeY [Defluviitaleaceae bacterium]|nr:rRNA maturation RNase YbeY [Defluviitaleaceae bacterium]